jgi:hypothetical protein
MYLYLKSGEGYYSTEDIPPSDYPKIIGGRYITTDTQEFIYTNLYNLKYLEFSTLCNICPSIAQMQQLLECSLVDKYYTMNNNIIIINKHCIDNGINTENVNIIFNKIDNISCYSFCAGTGTDTDTVNGIGTGANIIKLSLSSLSQYLLDTIVITLPITLQILIFQSRTARNISLFLKNNKIPYGCKVFNYNN